MAVLIQFLLPFLLLLSFSSSAQALVVPAHHRALAVRDHRGGHNHGEGPDAGSSAAEATSTAAATPTSSSSAASASSTDASSSTTYTGGEATYFYQEGAAGACGTVHSDSDLIVAIDEAMYSSDLCGKTVTITNTANSNTVTATVADECPGCSNSASLDLSVAAFEALGDLSAGVLDITWVLS